MDEALFQVVGSTDLPAMNRPIALPVGLIAVLVTKAVLLLMHVECVRALKRSARRTC